jgi:hypothetical protein
LTAVALIWLRIREPQVGRPVKTPLYPIVPVAYILFNIWILYHVTADKLQYMLAGMLFLSLGVVSHFIMRRKAAATLLILIPFAAHSYPTAAAVFEFPKICACT